MQGVLSLESMLVYVWFSVIVLKIRHILIPFRNWWAIMINEAATYYTDKWIADFGTAV